MHKVKQNRSAALYFLLSLLTLSIYHFYFLHKWAQDVNTICDGDGEKTAGLGKLLLLDLLTLGIYKYIWFAGLADRLYNNAPRYDVDTSWDGESAFLWVILGLPLFGVGPIIAIAMTIYATNRMARAYNAYMCGEETEKTSSAQAPARAAVRRPEPVPAHGEQAALLWLAGTYAGRRVPLSPGKPLVIGRSPAKASFIINDRFISRCHCEVEYGGAGCYYITDRSSTGVKINDRELTPNTKYRVAAGAVVSLADGKNRFRLV